MYMKTVRIMLLAVAAVLLSACEKPYSPSAENGGEGSEEGKVRLTLSVADVEQSTESAGQEQASRAVKSVEEVCSHISFVLYSGSYVKVKEVYHNKGDNDFEKATMSVAKGEYTLVVIAHNGASKATATNPQKITFDGKVTDTFYYSGKITVDGEQTYSLTLKRAVAMVRFVVDDTTPAEVRKMKFYYTGGSSTYDAIGGYGIVNSKQTEERTVSAAAYNAGSTYEIYTFPRADSESIKLTVSALDESGTTLYERVFESVPVVRNQITVYSGKFFGEKSEGGRGIFDVTVDDEWTVKEYTYGDGGTDVDTEQ